jgi:hypothetical protein
MSLVCTCGAIGPHFGCEVEKAARQRIYTRLISLAHGQTIVATQVVRRGCSGLRDLRPGARPLPVDFTDKN